MDQQGLLLLATSDGLVICERIADDWHPSRRELTGIYITCVVAQDDAFLAGTRDGIYRSSDRGRSWQAVNNGLSVRHIRWLAYHPDEPGRVYAGSEPADIFLSKDGGLSWQVCPEVAELRQQQGWYLPYSPEHGCVRGFAFSGSRAFAAVEVGGVLSSFDFGQTWNLHTGKHSSGKKIHPDVHSIETHPTSPLLVAAATGGGFFLSRDGGDSWGNFYADCYCRAVWWDPVDPEHLILGAADWVDRNGRIEESLDGGRTWSEVSGELNLPWQNHMVERFTQVGDHLLAVLSNGELLITSLESLDWRTLLPEVREVKSVAGFD